MACEALATRSAYIQRFGGGGGGGGGGGEPTQGDFDLAIEAAWIVLDEMVGHRPIRRCTYEGRPYVPGGDCGRPRGGVFPLLGSRPMHAGAEETIPLPSWVTAVQSVSIDDGAFNDYSVYVEAGVLRLERTDGAAWPEAGGMNGGPDVKVILVRGEAPSLIATNAALDLARDMIDNSLPAACKDARELASMSGGGTTLNFREEESTDQRFQWLNRLRVAYGVDVNGGPPPTQVSFHTHDLDGWRWRLAETDIAPA